MPIRLTVVECPPGCDQRSHSVEVGDAGGVIGRAEACDLVLRGSTYVSRVHARVQYERGHLYLFDTSTNGTCLYVESGPIVHNNRVVLCSGDRLLIGDFQIIVEIVQPDASVDADPFTAAVDPITGKAFAANPDDAWSADFRATATGMGTLPPDLPSLAADMAVGAPPAPGPFATGMVETPRRSTDAVDFAVFGPRRALPDSNIIVDIWAYAHGRFKEVEEYAAQLQRERAAGHKIGTTIERGAVVSIRLTISGADVLSPVEYLAWQGTSTNASFVVRLPERPDGSSMPGMASLSIDGIAIGNIAFLVEISGSEDTGRHDCQHYWLPISSAFASYASADRAEVLARLQGIRIVSPFIDIFLDVLSLRAGDDWAERLKTLIPAQDRLLLFWSAAASSSEWVAREWRIALDEKGIDHIVPVPLQDPRLAPPPEELAALHFNDSYLAHVAYERSRHSAHGG